MQLSPESGNVRSPLPDSSEHVWPDPAESIQIRPDQWPDPSKSSGIPAILARSSRISAVLTRSGRLLTMDGFRPVFSRNLVCRHSATVAGCRRIPAPVVFRWQNVAGFRCRLDSNDRQLPDYSNRISNVYARTKSLISENDLRFLFSKN
jgi:hypothetical protein